VRFGIHNSSWLDTPDPAEAFEAVKVQAQWAENHGFVWFSVLDHMIQIPRVGAPDEPFLEGWTVLAGLAAVTSRIRLATLATAVGFFEDEYKQYGWEFPPRAATRIRQMEEAVQLILKLWTEPRTTFHGRYFHVEDAILEPKPVQKPRPPVMIAGGGEQMTLRAVARLADACNIVGGDIAELRHKLAVLRGHCDEAGRDYDTIEKTHVEHWLLARNAAAVAAKRERLAARGRLRGFVGTVSEATDLIGQYQDAGVDLLINSNYQRDDEETRELFVSDVMPHFA
jgi:alkanesulfonate monooxygenase SsuD/methylene tetrahydromethanopterin reductase-like flavin-dependent oxidoreductase (luciferase family)